MVEAKKVVVIGGGPAGCVIAIFLKRRGFDVRVFEKRQDFRKEGVKFEGRSINMALSQRGRRALRKVNIEDVIVEQYGIEMSGRLMHGEDGQTTSFMPYGQKGQCILSIGRQTLNDQLLTACEREDIPVLFNTSIKSVDLQSKQIRFQRDDRDEDEEEFQADLIIGADGAFSMVRRELQNKIGVNYSQEFLDHSYKELHIPPKADGQAALSPVNALHIWPRGDFMMIALPNPDNSFTVTLFMPARKFEQIGEDYDKISQFFHTTFCDAVPLMPTLLSDYQRNKTSSLVTIKVFPWHYKDSAVILGDAAHAIVPFYGQGMNASLEDAVVLDEMFEKHYVPELGFGPVLEAFSMSRPVDANAIALLSHRNYLEMRSHVAHSSFIWRVAIEKWIERTPWVNKLLCLPFQFIPKYAMVAFSDIPYHEVIERDERQNRRLDLILHRILPSTVAALALGVLSVTTTHHYLSNMFVSLLGHHVKRAAVI